MNKKFLAVFAVYLYHIISILLTVKLAGDYGDALLITSVICSVAVLAVWTLIDIKGNIHRTLWFHFVLGTVTELVLYECCLLYTSPSPRDA